MAYQNQYNTARMISGGGNLSNYTQYGPLARSMAQRNVGIGTVAPTVKSAVQTDPRMAVSGALNPNLVTPSTLSTPATQPMNNPFGPGGTPPPSPGPTPPPAPTPTSDTRTQTGNGGGTSTIPGPSTGGPTQQGGDGARKVQPTINNMALQSARQDYATANSPYAKSAASDTIRQHQIAMGLIRPDGSTAAGDTYKAWLAAGGPIQGAQGQVLDTRGQPMSADAWGVGWMAGPQGAPNNGWDQGTPGQLYAPPINPGLK